MLINCYGEITLHLLQEKPLMNGMLTLSNQKLFYMFLVHKEHYVVFFWN